MQQGNRMIVLLPKHETMQLYPLPDFSGAVVVKQVILERRRFYHPWKVNKDGEEDFFEIWVPPVGKYTDGEIRRMRAHCDSAGVRFQLHDPSRRNMRVRRVENDA